MSHTGNMREHLRALPSLTGTPSEIVFDALPSEPTVLFGKWLARAVAEGVAEPHAMTVATIDADGIPDARMLALKDVDETGWAFASTASSTKGAQLRAHPAAALNFWWQPLMRAVRVRGVVEEASRADSEADLAARSLAARRDVAPGDWRLWCVRPQRVEFWQGSTDRRHTRIVYEATAGLQPSAHTHSSAPVAPTWQVTVTPVDERDSASNEPALGSKKVFA